MINFIKVAVVAFVTFFAANALAQTEAGSNDPNPVIKVTKADGLVSIRDAFIAGAGPIEYGSSKFEDFLKFANPKVEGLREWDAEGRFLCFIKIFPNAFNSFHYNKDHYYSVDTETGTLSQREKMHLRKEVPVQTAGIATEKPLEQGNAQK